MKNKILIMVLIMMFLSIPFQVYAQETFPNNGSSTETGVLFDNNLDTEMIVNADITYGKIIIQKSQSVKTLVILGYAMDDPSIPIEVIFWGSNVQQTSYGYFTSKVTPSYIVIDDIPEFIGGVLVRAIYIESLDQDVKIMEIETYDVPSSEITLPIYEIDLTAPQTPSNFIGNISLNKTVELNWNSNMEDDFSEYRIYRNGSLLTTTTGLNYEDTTVILNETYTYEISAVDNDGNESLKDSVTLKISDDMNVNLIPNGNSIVVQVSGGSPPYLVDWGTSSDSFSATSYNISGLELNTDYTLTVTDATGDTYIKTISTGNYIAFIPPVMPDPTSAFQKMVDSFGNAGIITVSVIGGAVALGIITILALYAWRFTKKWISTSK